MNGKEGMLYKFKDLLRLVWVILAIIVIVMITPMKKTDEDLKVTNAKIKVKVEKNEKEVAVLNQKYDTLEKTLKNIKADIRWLVRQQGGTPTGE